MQHIPAYRLRNATESRSDKAARIFVDGNRLPHNAAGAIADYDASPATFDLRFSILATVAVIAAAFIGAALATL
ncbi:hypothetical protein WKW50_16205 [Ochrobactrum sp. GPK 3]